MSWTPPAPNRKRSAPNCKRGTGRQMIAEATMRMESAPSVKAREKSHYEKENWERLLQRGQGVAFER